MSDNRGKGKRSPVALKIKFKSATVDEFVERYAIDLSHGGAFIRTKEPLPVGTELRFEFQLQDASPILGGDGTVVWRRESDPSNPGLAPGMGMRFDRLAPGGQATLDRILAQKNAGADESGFEGTPDNSAKTKIAPGALVEGLLARTIAPRPAQSGFTEESSRDPTPLPDPMPFHSPLDDDVADELFDQSTRVGLANPLLAENLDSSVQAPASQSEDSTSDRPAISERNSATGNSPIELLDDDSMAPTRLHRPMRIHDSRFLLVIVAGAILTIAISVTIWLGGVHSQSAVSRDSVLREEPRKDVTVSLITHPPGAAVQMDGVALPGVTPLVIDSLDADKTYTLRISLPCYAEAEIALRPSDGTERNIELTARPSIIDITSAPESAEVWIDGLRRGETPLALPLEADHTLELRRTGFLPWTKNLTRTASCLEERPGGKVPLHVVMVPSEMDLLGPKDDQPAGRIIR